MALARRHGIWIVHDLAYADIVFDGWKAPSILQVPGARDVAVEFFTMSKSYNMAGWRVGFMAGNRDLVAALAPHQGLSRLRHVHADPGRGHRGARGAAGLRRRDRRALPAPARRAVQGSARGRAGTSTCRRRRCTSGRAFPSRIARPGRSSSPRSCSPRRRCRSRRGSGFGEFGDGHVRFALIENENRIRQAVRGVKEMLRRDGLVPAVAA